VRLLSRLGAWLRSDRALTIAGERGGIVDAERLPRSPPAIFCESLLDAVHGAYDRATAHAARIDPAVYALIIPPGYGEDDDEEQRLADDLEAAVASLRAHPGPLSSLTWTTLREAHPPFGPDYRTWAEGSERCFEGEAGLVFFVDIEAVGAAVVRAAGKLGLGAHADEDTPIVRVSDGRFEARVGLHALIAESLWTARGPHAVVRSRARQLPSEMRSFQSLLGALTRRFPGARVRAEDDHLVLERPSESRPLDYRHLSASIRATGLTPDDYLARATLEDLAGLHGTPVTLIKSPAYAKAWPDALMEPREGHVLVIMREVDGRVRPVLRGIDDPVDRLDHHLSEAERQRGFTSFEGRVFGVQEGEYQAACLVGDNVASLASSPDLVQGFCSIVLPDREQIRVRSLSEDLIVLADVGSNDELIEETLRFAARLEQHLGDEPADTLDLDEVVDLPEQGSGQFTLSTVSREYFELVDEAERYRNTRPAHAHLLEGIALREIGCDDRALRHLERAVQANAQDGEANLALGRLLSDEGDPVRAVSFLARASDELPERGDAANSLGEALQLSGDSERARGAFEKAVNLEPDDPSFLVNLGRSYLESEEPERSREVLKRAVALDPESHEAHALLAMALHEIGEVDAAREHAREALDRADDAAYVDDLLTMLEDDVDADLSGEG
jgi:tetratricopeptide (TPR) repeat protein